MNINDLDFSSCLVNPLDTNEIIKFRAKHAELTIDDLTLNEENKDLKYVCLMYDLNSPIRDLYTDYNERKVQAAIISGYEVDVNKRFFSAVENALIGKNEYFNAMIVRYVIMHGLPDLMAFVANNELLAAQVMQSFHARDHTPNEVKIIRANIQAMTEEQNMLYDKIFGGRESQNLKNKLYETVEADNLNLRPEDVAKNLARGMFDPGIDPYSVGKVKQLPNE